MTLQSTVCMRYATLALLLSRGDLQCSKCLIGNERLARFSFPLDVLKTFLISTYLYKHALVSGF